MVDIRESMAISGVHFAHLAIFEDERGQFLESFRKEWFPQRDWARLQINRSDSVAGVLRGLHYHFRQVDYWHCVRGRIRVALADLRRSSPTRGATETLEIGDGIPIGVFIPVGIAHGFLALTPATLTYVVDNYYDSSDEFGVAWDDPQLNLDWGHRSPILSRRDQQNPHLADIPEQDLPR